MPHLGRFRKGWENEHLALFLLSRISFVANPLTVSDDVGSDFFCALFEVSGTDQLIPRNSFAIQIKSSGEPIDMTSKIEYLSKLELPFFIGVVDQGDLKLSIYSGEYLPVLFSHYGTPDTLKLSPESAGITYENYREVQGQGAYTLKCPHVLDLQAEEARDATAAKGKRLIDLSSRMLRNNSARVSCEYIFELADGRVAIFAGSGSAQTFEKNLCYRLAEAFYNLEWLYHNNRKAFDAAQYQALERCYQDLKNAGKAHMMLTAAYESAKRTVLP